VAEIDVLDYTGEGKKLFTHRITTVKTAQNAIFELEIDTINVNILVLFNTFFLVT